MINEITAYNVSKWDLIGDSIAESNIDKDEIGFRCRPKQYDYLASSPSIALPSGQYRITYSVHIIKGGITVGVVNKEKSWIKFNNHNDHETSELNIEKFSNKGTIQLIIAACNNGDGLDLEARFNELKVVKTKSGIVSKIDIGFNYLSRTYKKKWRGILLPKLCLIRLSILQYIGKLLSLGKHLKIMHPYVVLNSASGGYAVRGICMAAIDGKRYMFTADVGDDAISIFTIGKGKLSERKIVKFPYRSTPIHLSALSNQDQRQRILSCMFNFGGGNREQISYLIELPSINKLLKEDSIIDPKNHSNILLSRRGICGYRGVDSFIYDRCNYVISTVDRDHSRFHLLRGKLDLNSLNSFRTETVDLGHGAEPIGIGRWLNENHPQDPVYYLSLRGKPEIIVVACTETQGAKILQRVQLSGLSRSSVAIGNFKGDTGNQVAIAIWGGDPKDLNSVCKGEFFIADILADGRIGGIQYFPAGVHPTDVIAGDFDGDGRDELAVLNYGSGLGPLDRSHLGGVEIYKWKNRGMQKVSSIKLANPRIGAALDIDGDGVDELVVSLFFERKMVVLKAL